MANRPVFRAIKGFPYVIKEDVDFQYYSGFSVQRKQKCVLSLHKSFQNKYPESRILEISTKSQERIGYELSAFNLCRGTEKRGGNTVEQIFQSSKVFEFGGPYNDLLNKSSKEAKLDPRLRNSGKLIGFEYEGLMFPLEPKTFFYCWLYINILAENPELSKSVQHYNAFTDIEFNPHKSINCQAEAAAIYVGLCLSGKMTEALTSRDLFLGTVYQRRDTENADGFRQMSLADYLN